ncbi:uncharacterized protein ACA1_123370 [Acanthamoeba castellanii str. Neff]|uniref:PAS domain-containing protein n=1 Tax=Acanthamoeba castellanii (strain ATCC 30010 / Neff) TaxID=1257118 RepID=L8HGK0_ACACF|nr:uncharacterized protein ACA1_123370 [Acanthamoeba castellanii str. Neff]ELR23848.1 hypothetical protein ACA1_123370 [Acanthamoeba castellanii str. Neff]
METLERPCKRCVALGKPEDCVELYSTRRRGRPKRATEEQQRQLEQLQRELLEHRQYMFAQDQARERGSTTVVLGGPVSTGTFRDIKGEQQYTREESAISVPEREEVSSGVAGQLLEEFRKLSGEVREMRREIAQSLHETQFSLILPLIPTLDKGPSSPRSAVRTSSSSTTSSSSSSPQTSSCPSAPVLDSLYPASLEPYGHSFAATTATSSTPSAAAAAAAAAPDASLQAVTTSSFLSQLATSSAYHSPLPLSTLLSSNVSIYAQQPPTPSAAPLTQQQPTVSTTTPPSRGPSSPVVQRQQFGVPGAPTHAQDNITLYQQDAILPPNPQRYSLDGFGVSPSARNAMLAYLPFLSKYNITSSDVPFVVSDPEKPIVACAMHKRNAGDELRPRINFANTAFCDLSQYSIDELLGYSIRKFILLEDVDTWRDFRKGLLPSFIPLSPILNLRALSRRKDSSLLRINSRIQVFYDEQGFSGYYVLMVDDYEVLGTSPPASETVQLPADELDRQPLPAALPPRRPKHQNPGSW